MKPATFQIIARATFPVLLAAVLAACGDDGQGFIVKYSVGGAVTGLAGSGLVVQLNGGGNLALTTNGAFDFSSSLGGGAAYSVTVLTQPAGQYCSISGGIGTIATVDVVNVGVSCVANDPALLAYDGFNYVFGEPLLGKNGGLGWTAAWRVVDGNFAVDTGLGSAQSGTIAAGLNYTDSLGNRLITTDGAWKTDPAVFFGQGRRATSANFGAAGTDRWISFLVKQAAASAAPVSPTLNYVTANLGTGYTFLSAAMAGGTGLYTAGGVAGVGPFYGTGGASTTLSPAVWYAGAVGLVVLHVSFNANASANDTLELWFNPVMSDTDPGTPLLTTATANYADVINGVTLAWGDYRDFVIDEVRVGTNYAAVTPYR